MDEESVALKYFTNDENITSDNVLEKCRICLKSSNLTGLDVVIYENLTCNDILQSDLSLQLMQVEGFPENICEDCVNEIIKIHKFKVTIEDTDKRLHDIFGENTVTEIKIENPIIHQAPYNDHDYFMERKPQPTTCKPVKKPKKTRNEVKDKVTKALTQFLKNAYDNIVKDNYTCGKCGMLFENQRELREHIKKEGHSSPKLYPCTVCHKKFSRSKLEVHSRVHTKERPYVCKICNASFSIKSNLTRHIMIHTGERAHTCDICGKGFIQSLSLKLHRRIHFKDSSRRGPKPKDPNLPPDPLFQCEFCGREFKRIIMFQAHLKKHNATKTIADTLESIRETVPRPFKCPTCNQSYTSKQYLKQHQRIHGEKKFLCTACGKGFHQSGSLQTHYRMHTGEKPHRCKICDKSYAYVSSLESHMLQHSGEKPFACTICGRAFKQRAHLRHHVRVHTGEKPYKCQHCEKCFALKGNLTVHIRTHTGETPYTCDVCGKGFHDSSSMKKHKRGHGTWTVGGLEVKVIE